MFRTFLEQACHSQTDDGKNRAARIGGIIWWLFKKTFVWHLLDGKHGRSILSETVSRPETQFLRFLMFIVAVVFQAEMQGNVLKWVGY